MSIVSSNMITKHYCPHCESFDLLKLRRSFLQKHILATENKLQCRDCGIVLKSQIIEQNTPREVHFFLESETPEANTVGANNSEMFEDALNVVAAENGVQKLKDTPASESQKTDINTAQNFALPEYSEDDELIDETIFIQEEKGFWPYVVASLLVMFGAAYTFIWMPMSLSAEETSLNQVDMTIGKPVQMLAEIRQPEVAAEIKRLPESPVIEKESNIPSEAIQANAKEGAEPTVNLSDLNTQEEKAEFKLANEKPINKAAPVGIKSELQPPEKADVKAVNPWTIPDSGTKADIALGGLITKETLEVVTAKEELPVEGRNAVAVRKAAKAAISEENESLVEVPLPEASVSTDVVSTSEPISAVGKVTRAEPEGSPIKDIVIEQSLEQIDPVAATKTPNSSSVITKSALNAPTASTEKQKTAKPISLNKKAAALLGVSVQDLKALTEAKPSKPVKKIEKQVSQKQYPNTLLLEKATVKFIQQDLDKLLLE